MLCERCRAEIRSGYSYPPGVDPDVGTLTVNGEVRHLSLTCMDLLRVLWTRRGSLVHRESLIRLMWGSALHLASPETNLREVIRRVRIKTAGAPFSIVTDHKLGYMLVEDRAKVA
jgi:DNA-binding response OmpR family regulator